MKIRVGFSYRKLLFSRLLRWAERRPYSHVYIRYKHPITNQDLILHASGSSIHTLTLENFRDLHHNIIVKEYEIEVSEDKVKDMMSFMFSQSGTPYGNIQLFGMAAVKFMAFLGKSIKNPLSDKKATMVCSEFCAYILSIGGIVPNIDLSYAEQGGPSWIEDTLKNSSTPEVHEEF